MPAHQADCRQLQLPLDPGDGRLQLLQREVLLPRVAQLRLLRLVRLALLLQGCEEAGMTSADVTSAAQTRYMAGAGAVVNRKKSKEQEELCSIEN